MLAKDVTVLETSNASTSIGVHKV